MPIRKAEGTIQEVGIMPPDTIQEVGIMPNLTIFQAFSTELTRCVTDQVFAFLKDLASLINATNSGPEDHIGRPAWGFFFRISFCSESHDLPSGRTTKCA
jgi:hypothetical protein